MGKKPSRSTMQWHAMDIHIHTTASADFQQPGVTVLEMLQKAESRGLEIVSFTDHNTIAGYRSMREEIEQLELLEKLNRMMPDERQRLAEYRRLLGKILVLPGFEFTATLGFHILAFFSPQKAMREIEHLLLSLNIPPQQIDEGNPAVGASTDVLTAYRMISDSGGLVIAAHANSSNGVAMRGLSFGGQTRIAYTQDLNLHALEVTDLELKGPRSTAGFFNGTKPEYPRRMHCIQGSDCHRVSTDSLRKKNLGIGDRATDVYLPEVSFEALRELFLGNDFSRTRPHRRKEEPAYDFLQAALEQGSNIIQDFHDNMTVRGGKLYSILVDVCAFANTNGGTLYIGLPSDPAGQVQGVTDPEAGITQLEKEINNRISPPILCTLDIQEYKDKKIIRILVPKGEDAPYAVDDNKIYIRDEAETSLAVRDEIVGLVLRGKPLAAQAPVSSAPIPTPAPVEAVAPVSTEPEPHQKSEQFAKDPRTGVEVLPPEERKGTLYYSMRDLRNGNLVKNVTQASARRLWHYGIKRYSELAPSIETASIQWHGDYGMIRKYQQGNSAMYDLISRTPDGYRFFFGVTQDGIHGIWKVFAGDEEA